MLSLVRSLEMLTHLFFGTHLIGGQVDSSRSSETPEITEMTENFTKVTKYLTKLKETLINYDWEKSHLIK